jgi:hypothetical protein
MTWRGREEALERRTVDEFVRYLRALDFSGWKPSGMVLHNTASPTLEQWWQGGTTPEQRMGNLRDYYEDDMGWPAGPHAFIDGVSIWVFMDFNVKGVHSPSWNGTRLGIEMVGDYDAESDARRSRGKRRRRRGGGRGLQRPDPLAAHPVRHVGGDRDRGLRLGRGPSTSRLLQRHLVRHEG